MKGLGSNGWLADCERLLDGCAFSERDSMKSLTIKSRLEKFSSVNAGPLGKSVRPEEELAWDLTDSAMPGEGVKGTLHRHCVRMVTNEHMLTDQASNLSL
jgi:hypothetical protein